MRKFVSIILVIVMTCSLLCVGAYAVPDLSGAGSLISNVKNNIAASKAGNSADNYGVSTMSLEPPASGTVTPAADGNGTITVTAATGETYNIEGNNNSVVLNDVTSGTATAYLYGTFKNTATGTAIQIGSGWTVYVCDTSAVTTTVSAATTTGGKVYGIRVSGTSTVTLDSGTITANCSNTSGTMNAGDDVAYGVYAENGAAVIENGTTVNSIGTAGNYGITAVTSASITVNGGEVYAQGEGSTGVYVNNAALTVTGSGTSRVPYIHSGVNTGCSAVSITGNCNWSVGGAGALMEGYNGLMTSTASAASGPISGGTYISHGGSAISVTGGYASIAAAMPVNYYLRDANAVTDYAALSNGGSAVSANGSTVSGSVTVTDAEAELVNAMSGTVTGYTLPCDVALTYSTITTAGVRSLDLNGHRLSYTGTVITVAASSTLTITDSAPGSSYTNLGGTSVPAAGIVLSGTGGCAVEVKASGNLVLGASNAYGPMITAVDTTLASANLPDLTSGPVGILNNGNIIVYSCSVYGTLAGIDMAGGVVDVKASGTAGAERAVFCGKAYGLRQTSGALTVAGGIFTTSPDLPSNTASTTAAAPWALYVNYGAKGAGGNTAASTNLTGGYYESVGTDGFVNGRSRVLGDLMGQKLSFIDGQTVTPTNGYVASPKTYIVASPAVMCGDSNTTSKGEWDNYKYYGYAIYGGMNAAGSQRIDSTTGAHAATLSADTFTAYFTVGDNTVYDTIANANKKVCTCCGAEYTGNSCPNCTNSRCSVCGKCPNHCTCKNTHLSTDDHYAYITGVGNYKFQPNGTLTRAQAATIFYKLMQNKNYISSKNFIDVNHNDWYYTAVSCLASKGVIAGYQDGTFKPNGKVTRAEFCAMASRFYSLKETTIHFSDVPVTHWAYKYIASAVAYGWISDSTGRYYPGQAITRQEAVTLVNAMTSRIPDEYFIDNNLAKLNTFNDVPAGTPAYYQIIEAANGHSFVQTNGVETWKAVQ